MSQQKIVLIVDDESSLVQLCRIVLESAGYVVRGAYNGAQALRMLNEEERPDLVLLDVMMPGMNGIEVCRQIKTDFQSRAPLIVMYTADNSDSTRRDSLEAGANDLLTKEIPIYELPSRINKYLA
jgi:CheY-like chemotaxis protein